MKTTTISAADKNCAKIAAQFLKKGFLIVYPTETSYGIGADIENKAAVKKVFSVKNRPPSKDVAYIVASLAMAKKYGKLTKQDIVVAKKFMPGPLTLVVHGCFAPEFAFRIPDNKTALPIVRQFGHPITATSANISGEPPLYKIRDVFRHFQDKVSLIVDAGDLPITESSTVADLFSGVNIRREGPISCKEIYDAINSK